MPLDKTDGQAVAFNLNATTLIKDGSGRVVKVSVLFALSSPGLVYDAASVGEIAVGKVIAAIPAAVGVYELNMPFYEGLVVQPDAQQILAISYN